MRRPVVIALLGVGYMTAFVLLQPRIGDAVVSLSVLPIVGAAWLYGLRGGLAGGVLVVCINIALMQTIGDHHGFRPTQVPRILVAIGLGGAAGWARDAARRLRHLLGENQRIEAALRAGQEGLEKAVADRTAELVRANESLLAEIATRRDAEARIAKESGERKELEARAAAADRMAVIGMLTAGIGHEINNPLAVICTNLEYIQSRISDPTPAVLEALHDARGAAQSAGEIVRHMRIFIQSSASDDVADVKKIVDSTIRMVANEIRHRARLEVDVQGRPVVALAEAHLGQVLLNLLVNASQALPARPTGENRIRVGVGAAPDKEMVRLEVTDTGSGIPEDVQARIFDPFFTTKPVGMGTGLGLWVCHQIVTCAGGEITVDSAPGRGTTFRIDLPRASSSAAAATLPKPPPPARRARLLVIDDDPRVGRSIGRLIRGRHDFVVTDDAPSALAEIDAGQRYDVILCDLMMPAMTGMEFFARLQEQAPDQATRVIFMTGGAFTPEASDFILDPNHRHLEKPFAGDVLEEAIQAVLS